MTRIKMTFIALVAGAGLAAGCATAPKTPEARENLKRDAQATLQTMKDRNPYLGAQLDQAYAYAVFPRVGKGGVVVGGAYGKGVVYEGGRHIGYVELTQAGIGAQLGAQTFAELILFANKQELDELRRGGWDVGASASAVFLTSGRAEAFDLGQGGPVVIIMPREGAMLDLSVTGQEIDFTTVPI
jgi:lipid-binding SYLF domain-containing protein